MDCSNLLVDSCSFIQNITAVNSAINSTITNSIFVQNNTSLKIGDNTLVTNNQIIQNQIGLVVNAQQPSTVTIIDNQLCDNLLYNLENATDKNYNLSENCFCLNDSLSIENSIYDGYDDIARGLVNFAIYDDSCTNILQYIVKVNLEGTNSLTTLGSNSPEIYLNTQNYLVCKNCTETYTIWDVTGRIVGELKDYNLDVSDWKNGMYFITNVNGFNQQFSLTR